MRAQRGERRAEPEDDRQRADQGHCRAGRAEHGEQDGAQAQAATRLPLADPACRGASRAAALSAVPKR